MKPGYHRKNHAEAGGDRDSYRVCHDNHNSSDSLCCSASFSKRKLHAGAGETLQYNAFTDIGNGVSTRIVDVYAIAPTTGNITSSFNLPDDVAGQNYFVDIYTGATAADQGVMVYQGNIVSNISLAGIANPECDREYNR